MFNNKDKVIFFDIDGTLFEPHIGIPESTIYSLNKLKENNVSIVICTGRARAMVPQSIIALGFDGIIAGAGTYVEINENVIYEISLDCASSSRLITDIRNYGLIPILEGHKVSYYDDTSQDEDYRRVLNNYFKEAKPNMLPIPENYSNICIAKASARFTSTGDDKGLFEKYKNEYNIVCHSGLLMEFIPKYTSKAKGIEVFLKETGIKPENTYAFGDSMNDLEMLQYVQYGIAMGNSSDEFKQKINYITDDIDKDGIYNALVNFKLI